MEATEEEKQEIEGKRKEMDNLKVAEMQVKAFPEASDVKTSASRNYVARIIKIEDLRWWLRRSAHFRNNKLHNYIEMKERFDLKG